MSYTFGVYTYLNSAAVGPYYDICCDVGYPQCDIVKYHDGEWAIIAYENAPLVPSLTKWRVISSGIRHKEISHGLVHKLIINSDPMKAALWEREKARSLAVESEHKSIEANRDDILNEAVNIVKRNDSLMQRVAKNGLHELDLGSIARHVEPEKLIQRIKVPS